MSQTGGSLPPSPIAVDNYSIIPHPTAPKPRVLLMPDEQGWTLPRWIWPLDRRGHPFWQEVDGVNRLLRERLGLDATTLRCVHAGYNPQRGRRERVYEIAPRTPAWTAPPLGRWLDRAGVDDRARAAPAHRALLDRWFAEATDPDARRRRPPWAHRGWLAAATAWLDAQLARLGLAATAPPEQLRTWERSCLLRARTAAGPVYFKAVPAMFAHEPALTAALSRWFPGEAPTVLALDADRGWLLTADFGGAGLDGVPDLERWMAALRRFAELQIAAVDRAGALHALGCPAQPVTDLPAGLDALLADRAATLPGEPGGLTEQQVTRLHALAPRLRAHCRDLARSPIPATLEHGDLWASNVIATTAGYLYFDWSDSALSHPFFSPFLFLMDAEQTFPAGAAARPHLRDAYLAPWSAYAPREDLATTFALAQQLAPLHYAVKSHRDILPHIGAKWQLSAAVPFYLGLLLAREATR